MAYFDVAASGPEESVADGYMDSASKAEGDSSTDTYLYVPLAAATTATNTLDGEQELVAVATDGVISATPPPAAPSSQDQVEKSSPLPTADPSSSPAEAHVILTLSTAPGDSSAPHY